MTEKKKKKKKNKNKMKKRNKKNKKKKSKKKKKGCRCTQIVTPHESHVGCRRSEVWLEIERVPRRRRIATETQLIAMIAQATPPKHENGAR
jgi:hypothetical protein